MGKKVLVWAYFAKNVGDDLFLKILIDRYPHVKWELLTANRNYRKVFRDYNNVKIIYSYREIKIGKKIYNPFFKINELFLKYKKYDAIVNIGGSIFMQGLGWKKRLNERKYLVTNFRKRNKRAYILGANFGPFKSDEFIGEYKEIFASYNDVCFRDYYSYNLFKGLSNVRMATDLVFNLEFKDSNKKEKIVGFSVINLEGRDGLKKYTEQYNDKVTDIIGNYIKSGYKIKLFSFCSNEGDLEVINNIKSNLNYKYRKQIKIVNYTGHLDSFLAEFKRCQIIIGTRFHSLILAMLYNQSFYPLIYSEKTVNLLQDLGHENKGCHIKDIASLDLNDIIPTVRLSKTEYQQVIYDAGKQFEKLDDYLGRRSG